MNAMMADKLEIVPNADLMPAAFKSFFVDYLACEDEMMERTIEFQIAGAMATIIRWAACGIELGRKVMPVEKARIVYADLVSADAKSQGYVARPVR